MTSRPEFTDRYVDLAQPRLGAEVISATDDFFAPMERLIQPEAPVFIADKYDEHGKWMDGWESRRKRGEGHDHCVVRLCPGVIHGADIDTSHFTGNFPPRASLEACHCDGDPGADTQWQELLPVITLQGDAHHYRVVEDTRVWTHVRLHIYPDGGVARLRIYGIAHADWSRAAPEDQLDLAAMSRGGRALSCSNMHYGHMSNLIAPGHAINMGDGWETSRRRGPGNDWVILQLAHPGRITRAVIDTAFFKGNYPDRCSIQGGLFEQMTDSEVVYDAPNWFEILPPQKLGPDQVHSFEKELSTTATISHVRVDIYPDGGVSRLRLFGNPDL